MNPVVILIIDDEVALRGLLARILRLESFSVHEAGTLQEGKRKLADLKPQIILCDVKLPDGNGVEAVPELLKGAPFADIILLTAYGNIPDGVRAIHNGAYDYLVKGNDNDRIIPLISRALEKQNLQRRIRQLERTGGHLLTFDNILGRAPAVQTCIALARRVAPTDATVLLTGETGTGKEVFAQAIHTDSYRVGRPFVAINCSTFGRELLESELFGHRAGAFTGAMKDQKGLIEEARGGTLFLDEIGEMAPELQAKLLRVLETGEYMRIGDTRTIKADVRFIAATHRNLTEEVAQGRFREDLYYRLSVFEIRLPALRERPEDIPELARHFAALAAEKLNRRQIPVLTEGFLWQLGRLSWKGNLRELRNVVERAVILADTELTADLVPGDAHPDSETPQASWNLVSLEKKAIQRALEHAGGNKSETARLLGIAPATLYRKLKEYGLSN
ncbi:MAG: sigma-54 dependent transcriptional regulator [Saprospiraceae bacterium]|nr:sigma-54 dependent transcriptional regulator [Saprospiraceae bacterium]